MIFTHCTHCNEAITLDWEQSDGYGFIRHRCEKCDHVSVTLCTLVEEVKTITEKDFMENYTSDTVVNKYE